ncbi:MAG TPA: tetratricopeptide repeat protein, partial [Caulobacteraceae bacterium]
YRAAAVLDPINPAIFTGLALSLLGTGDLEASLEVSGAVLGLVPDDPEAWYVKGRALLLLHQPQAAAAAFERGVALAADDSRMHLGLGDAYAALDLNQLAVDHLTRAAALDPASKWAHANLGSMLYRSGDLEGAERCCRRALDLDPALANAHQNLSGILADRGQAEEARHHRDAAYGIRNIVVERAPRPRANVLVLTTADSGNVPHRFLLPADRYSRIDWFIEYAPPGQAAELPPFDVVFNIIGDSDYSGPTDAAVAAFVEGCDRQVLNHPARIGPTRRDRLPELLAGIEHVLAPKAARLDEDAGAGCDLAAWVAAAGLSYPLLLRPIGSHGGRGLTLVRAAAELEGIDAEGGAYATEFIDFSTPADGLFRKYRVIFVDRRPYPYHLAISGDWLVHYETAGMWGHAAHQAEELRFLEDPGRALGPEASAAISAIGARLDLDYAGVDFSILPDGRVLVFEANATMLVHPEAAGELAHKNPYVERITSAFQALIERSRR